MSIFRRFIERIYGSPERIVVPFSGLERAGKTTLLYLLTLDKFVTTSPTIGFNIEWFKLPTLTKSGRGTESSVEITGIDTGIIGCGGTAELMKFSPVWLKAADALIWVVDSLDRERLEESVDSLRTALASYQGYHQEQPPGEEKVKPIEQIPILM